MEKPTTTIQQITEPSEGALELLRRKFQDWDNRFTFRPFIAESTYQKQYLKKVAEPIIVKMPLDRQTFAAIVWQIMNEEKFQLNEFNKTVAINLVAYFSGNTGAYPLHKGIYLYGPTGTGKTTLMRIIQKARARMGVLLAMKNLPTFCAELMANNSADILPLLVEKELVVDDAGAEKTRIVSYGNSVHPFPEIIMGRYELHGKGIRTHCTSNIQPKEILKIGGMGEREVSRMKEMFTSVLFAGPDYRS